MKGLLPGYKKCFFCGPATGGLGLELKYMDSTASCEFTAQERFQGYHGMLHGGIVTGILDEVMWWALFMKTKKICATWKMEAEFKRPIMCGKTYRASGQFVSSTHNMYYLSAMIEDETGKLCAQGKASFRKTRGFTMNEIIEQLDFRGVPCEIRSIFQSLEM
ncbi:MAG TPA: PaaI family thioesterase [Syntrophorhabdus sp.]|jgi:uncharacterized protein (TIGR00369 family)|nr:PaaI family thioesterase [Syntrophorhabdus sp.]HNQ45734.1 PaaI family thioesterase [Syntrophorhabdus sp.]HNS78980.1 PaaI family thioesterase [Syntrophorhabdus sp.]HNY69678.1 PaaI family thioesterase [Syntrophorhabdus sp.]HOH26000.1 PaaI family thioesterase [Syntrophorhabdus sp.]